VATILTILLNARDAGDFSDAAGEWETASKCGSLPRDAGDLVGLLYGTTEINVNDDDYYYDNYNYNYHEYA